MLDLTHLKSEVDPKQTVAFRVSNRDMDRLNKMSSETGLKASTLLREATARLLDEYYTPTTRSADADTSPKGK